MQRALMHYFKPYNRQLVLKALKKAGREDLIGWGGDCLIAPYVREKKKPTEKDTRTSRRDANHGRRRGR